MAKNKLLCCIFVSLIFLIFSMMIVKSEWTQYQFSSNSSGFFPNNNSFDSATLINLTNSMNGSNIQPLVSDLNGDDVNEIVVFNATNIFVYNTYLNLKTQYALGGNILGQPTLFNVSGNKGLELMLSLNVTDVHYFIIYNYSTTFTSISNISIANNLTGSGIKCTDLNSTKSCVFMDNSFFIHVVNLSNLTNPVDNATQVSSSPNRANTTNYETTPAIADFDSDGNKEALFWNDNDAGDRFGFVVFDLIAKTKKAFPSSFLPYSSNEKVNQPIFVSGSRDSTTQITFAINTVSQGKIYNYNGTGSLPLRTTGAAWPQPISTPDNAFISSSLLAIDCDSDGLEDIAGMAYGGSTPGGSRLFCYNGNRTQLYSIDDIISVDIIEKTATAVNISGNSTPEIVTYKGIYSFNGSLVYGFSGLGTQAPVPVDVNNDGKLDFLWADGASGVKLFVSNDSIAPAFSNLTKSPEISFKNQIVYVNITWQDSAGVDAVYIAHNGTENWVNYTADISFGNNIYNIYNLTIPASSSNYSFKVIGWYSTANDTAGNRNTTLIQTFIVNNQLPNATNLSLNNTDFLNRTNGSLAGSWQFSDVDNTLQQSNETFWYVNGVENQSFRNLTIISPENTTKGQNWTFSVRVFDGANWSDFANSTYLVIQNSLPTQSAPIITSNDDQNRKNGTLTCNNQSTVDLDSDFVVNFIRWDKNSILIETAINSTSLNQGNYSKNDNITCEITPNDGTGNGTSLNSANFTILNAAPLLNASIENKTWNQDTSTTINLSNIFIDIDGDNLTYNFTYADNIEISINNNTKIITLAPASGFSGTRTTSFFALDGVNITTSNNVTFTVNAVLSSSSSSNSSSSSSSGGGGGGISNGYICNLDWECTEWSSCENGKETRKCKLKEVPNFISLEKCPQNKIPEQGRDCKVEIIDNIKESCDDKFQNQGEEGIDCGGPCGPCFSIETRSMSNGTAVKNVITGAVIAKSNGFKLSNLWPLSAVVLAAIIVLLYFKFVHKKIFRNKEQLSDKEMEKLNDILPK